MSTEEDIINGMCSQIKSLIRSSENGRLNVYQLRKDIKHFLNVDIENFVRYHYGNETDFVQVLSSQWKEFELDYCENSIFVSTVATDHIQEMNRRNKRYKLNDMEQEDDVLVIKPPPVDTDHFIHSSTESLAWEQPKLSREEQLQQFEAIQRIREVVVGNMSYREAQKKSSPPKVGAGDDQYSGGNYICDDEEEYASQKAPLQDSQDQDQQMQFYLQTLQKLKQFLGSYIRLQRDPFVAYKLKTLIVILVAGGMTLEQFEQEVQAATGSYFPFSLSLRDYFPILQHEICYKAHMNNLSPLEFVIAHEESVFEHVAPPPGLGFYGGRIGVQQQPYYRKYSIADGKESSQENVDMSHVPSPKNAFKRALEVLARNPSYAEDYQGEEQLQCEEVADAQFTKDWLHRRERTTDGEKWNAVHLMLSSISEMVEETRRVISTLHYGHHEMTNALSPCMSLAEENGTSSFSDVQENYQSAGEAIRSIQQKAQEQILKIAHAGSHSVNNVTERAINEIQQIVDSCKPVVEESVEEEEEDVCWNCNRKATLTCSDCKMARYCGRYCRIRHMSSHKRLCRGPQRFAI